MEYKVDYNKINEEWDYLKTLDNTKPNLDKKWIFIYNLTLKYAKAILEREKRFVEDIDGRVCDQVARLMARIKDGFVMDSAKYCSLVAMAATHNRTVQERFEEDIFKYLNGENGYAEPGYKHQWDNDCITNTEWM